MKLTKVYPIASFKALEDEGPGKFEAVVSVFGNVDYQGDRSMPGMFKSTLNRWRKSGDPVPCIWSHDWLNPDAFIGEGDPNEMMEILKPIGKDGTGGLLVKGTMDIDKPFAGQVFDLLKSRRIKEWSFAYDTVRETTNEKDGANELLEVELIEFGPCLKGANPLTYTAGAKSALETELKEAYDRAKTWQQRIDRIGNWAAFDPQVAAVLTKTYTEGTYDAKGAGNMTHVITDESELEGPVVDADEKAGTKPWHIEERGEQFCVIKDDSGETVTCHDTREEAEAHMRALYANESSEEPEAEKSETAEEKIEESGDNEKSADTSEFNIVYNTASTADGSTTWTISAPPIDGSKIGRVIGAKAAEELKEDLTKAITGAVDRFVAKINGTGVEEEEKADEAPETKTEEPEVKVEEPEVVDPDAELKARLMEVFGG